MGNCDFTKNQAENTGTINKNTFQQNYVVGRGGYGKVYLYLFRCGKSKIKETIKTMQ